MTPPPPFSHGADSVGSDSDFDEALRAAVRHFADQAPAPVFGGAAIHRTSRRRSAVRAVGATAAAFVVVCGAAFTVAQTAGGKPTTGTAAAPVARCAAVPSAAAPTATSGDATPVIRPSGSGTVRMPNLIGVSQATAVDRLTVLGLRCELVFHTDWKVPAGKVIDVDARPGQQVPAGSTRVLFISKGRPGS